MPARYLPTDQDSMLTHVVEECAEVIQAAMKIQRFGWANGHPDKLGHNNTEELLGEISDLKQAIYRLERTFG